MQMLSKLVAIKLSHYHPAVAGVRGLAGAPFQRTRAADPAVHSEDRTGEDAEQAARALAEADKEPPRTSTVDNPTPSPPQPAAPYDASPKLESSELGRRRRTGLNLEQRRSHANLPRVEGASCDVGVDGGSIVEDQKEDYKDYYKDHRPSPISEIEVADTRKPITKATSGGAYEGGGEGGEWAGWSEEQLDAAEEALRRAEAIFWERAAKGIPDWPHSHALRRLIGHELKGGLEKSRQCQGHHSRMGWWRE